MKYSTMDQGLLKVMQTFKKSWSSIVRFKKTIPLQFFRLFSPNLVLSPRCFSPYLQVFGVYTEISGQSFSYNNKVKIKGNTELITVLSTWFTWWVLVLASKGEKGRVHSTFLLSLLKRRFRFFFIFENFWYKV